MAKCCRNCRFYNRTGEVCERDAIMPVPENTVEENVYDLLENGRIHELCEELGLPDVDSESGEIIAEFIKTHFRDRRIHVHILRDLDFYCSEWQ